MSEPKKRQYYLIEGKDPDNPGQLKYVTRDIECDDNFDGELVMLSFPIGLMKEISSVLKHFKLRDDAEYFYSECREVVSVPEKHVNEKGEGKLTFQSYFHKFPESVSNFFDDALVVVMLDPKKQNTNPEARDYWMAGYIQANIFDFKDHNDKLHTGYYYNVLRMSERTEDGVPAYRRKRVFTSMFAILLDLVTVNDIHFVYATMGRENQGIVDALKMNSQRHNKFFEMLPMQNNTQVNLFFGSKSAAGKLINISNDKERLKEYYQKLIAHKQKYVFNQMHSEDRFFGMVNRILNSSPSSGIYMIPDANGNIDAAGLMMNWGDYMHLKLQNPKGVFKIIASLNITDKLLYTTMLTGSQEGVKKLLKGAAYKFRKDHGIQLTVMNGYTGDPYFDLKKSIVSDPFVYFVIYDRPEDYQAMKDYSKNENGDIRIFIDTPML
jgi:hypothetical protein